MKRLTSLLLLCSLLPAVAFAKVDVEHSSGPCYYPGNGVWTRIEIWQTTAQGSELVGTMGIGCNGRAFNTCGNLNDLSVPARPYYDAAFGDSVRAKLGDNENHLTMIHDSTQLELLCDRPCWFKVFNLETGAVVYQHNGIILGGKSAVISTSELEPGPYMAIAYDAILTISVGYDTFLL